VPASDPNSIGVVLAEVRDMGPVTVAEIVAGIGLSPSTVRRHLADLETSGLVESDDYPRAGTQRRVRVYMDPR
jgi:predicted ArsR family transcriptional regulator